MKLILFCLSISSIVWSHAQDPKLVQKPVETSKFSFGWTYSPELAYRFIGESELANDYFTETQIELREEAERPKYGQSLRFFCGYRLSQKLTLEAGIGVTDFGDGLKPYDVAGAGATEPAIMTGRSHLIYATVPISLQFNFGKKQCRWFVSAGVAPGYRLWYEKDYKVEYSPDEFIPGFYPIAPERDEVSKFILEARISGGADIRLNEKLSLRIAPEFKISATDNYSEYDVRANYYNAGIELGVIRRF